MSDADLIRWQQRYAAPASAHPTACAVLREQQYLLPASGDALDLACGLGGNALLLAEHGLDTWAWDIAANAISSLPPLPRLHAEVRDLVAEPPPAGRFDVIVVSRFLDRDLCPAIAAALKPGGLLFYQTFVRDAVDASGPRNPAYRLAPGELLTLFKDLRPLYYADPGSVGDSSHGPRNEAQLVAIRATENDT